MTKILIGLIFLTISSCGLKFPSGQKCFKRTKVLVSSYSTQKFWDEYLDLRKGGFFNYYIKPFGIGKASQFKGTYEIKSDTLFLKFCEDPIPENLIGQGLIDLKKNEIVLINGDTIFNKHLYIKFDRRTGTK